MAEVAKEVATSGSDSGCVGTILNRLIIPATLAILGTIGGLFQLALEEANAAEVRSSEQRIYENGVVATYVTDISGLVTAAGDNVELLPCKPYVSYEAAREDANDAATLMRGRTLLALSQVENGITRGQVLRFIADVGVASVMDFRDLQYWDFSESDLQGACLFDFGLASADFTDAWLTLADLDGADIEFTTFDGATLFDVRLIETAMYGATFIGADLENAYMIDADARAADFSGANFLDAYMDGVMFDEDTIFNEETILPDGSMWTPETDMRRFTDASRSDFWNACDERAYYLWYCEEFNP